ncbi:lysine--tRNA ligase [Candidatus Pacearchaeota archaeon]|nr:lysine--tRNA ligase [Candidatus Pacearchaeota archaeon]
MEKFFWADEIADRIIREKGKKKEYICASGITPSGKVHIGNFREVITTDLVVKALKEKGKKVKFIYSWDDFDRFRKVPAGIDKEYEKYIGMPISDIPSPFDKKKSYAEYFEKEFENSLEKVGIKPNFIRQSIMNKKCKYASLIKLAIEKKETIIKILNKYRKEPLVKDWMPVMIYCEKCKKDSAKIIKVEGDEIEYECKCGYKGKVDFSKKGVVSVRWRVDWPMRWFYEKVDFEPGGIDHSVYGGSLTTSKEIVKEIFRGEPPIYQFYDWIGIKGGKEFSSSKGNALTLDDVEEIYEPEVLRYIFVGTKPKTGFQISFDNDVIKIYEDYDALEKKYYEGKANPREKRIYELSQIKLSNKKPEKISFRHLISFVQTGKINELNKDSKKRAEKVKNWLKKYAGEDMKFEVQKKVSVKLNKKEKEALIELRKILEKKDYNEKELFNEFYEICKKVDIKNIEFFDATYRVLINKKKGPRLASLILNVGKDKIIKLLNQIK